MANLRLQVTIKVLPGIPFFKNTEFIFILHTPVKVAGPHPFSVLGKPIGNAIVWDSPKRFSARTFIRTVTRIMQILVASGKPTTGESQKAGIIL